MSQDFEKVVAEYFLQIEVVLRLFTHPFYSI